MHTLLTLNFQLCKQRGSGKAKPLSAFPVGFCGFVWEGALSLLKIKPWPPGGIQPDW